MGPISHKERDLFSVRVPLSKDKPNKKRKKQKSENDEGSPKKKTRFDGLVTDDIQPLTYQNITTGQVILGCVQEVRDYELVVSLPHLLVGTVTLARISKAYTSLLIKVAESEGEVEEKVHTLKELYKPGQYVVTRVVSLEEVNSKVKVDLTLMPQEVNFGISSSFLEAGHVIVCAVSSVEDNGYVMDTGIPNVRAAFLKNTHVEGSAIVGVGSVVRCLITKLMGKREEESTVRLHLSAAARAVSEATLDLCDTTNMALLLPGTAINTSVSKIYKHGLKVLLAEVDGVVNRLHLQTPFSQSSQYDLAYKVRARVLYVMPLTKVVHLTLQPSVCSKSPEPDPLHGLNVGERVEEAEIYESKRSGIFVKLGEKCRGFCSCNHLTDKGKPPRYMQRDFPVGGRRMCRLIKYNYMDQLFIVSLQKSVIEQQTIGYQGLEAGQVVKATIKKYIVHGAEVAVSKFVSGQIPYQHLTDSRMQDPKKKHNVGDVVKARVLKVNPERRHMLLTCKKQLVEYEGDIITEFSESFVGTVTRGCIVSILSAGLLINLYNDVKGFVPKSTTKATKEDKLDDVYEVGQVVDCKVLKVFPEKKSMTLSLDINKGNHVQERNKPVDEESEEAMDIAKKASKTKSVGVNKHIKKEHNKPVGDESEEAMEITEKVSKTESLDVNKNKCAKKEHNKSMNEESEEAVEITEKSSKTKSLEVNKNKCAKKEHSKPVNEESEEAVEVKEKVSKTKSLDVNKNKPAKKEHSKPVGEESEEAMEIRYKVSKTKNFDVNKNKNAKKECNKPVGVASKEPMEITEKISKRKKKANKPKSSEVAVKEQESDHGDSGVEEMDSKEEEKESTTSIKSPFWLSIGTGFVWDVPETQVDTKASSSDEDDDDNEVGKRKKTKKLSKAERIAAAKEEERRLHQLECARLEDNRNPQTALDFEELLQCTPNSSTLWIQFISFHLENAELEQAKAVARRALQVVDPQEEEERLNLWTVLLRLEVTYGTPEEVAKAYTEAQAACDQLKVQMAMAMVYSEANKFQEAEKVYYVMSKKFNQVLDVWVKAGIYFFSHMKAEEGRRYMERALLSLNKKHHVELINRFGQLEFRFGEAERGRTMFESLLSSYPKRIDVWSVYVDLLAKHGDYEGARHILDRMTGLKLRLRKMRFVFKKFLEFEKEHGTSQSVEAVKKRVEEFVTSALHQDA